MHLITRCMKYLIIITNCNNNNQTCVVIIRNISKGQILCLVKSTKLTTLFRHNCLYVHRNYYTEAL